MKNPKSKKVYLLADYFQAIACTVEAEQAQGVVCMSEPEVREADEHLCGTPACHAGWFGAFYPKQIVSVDSVFGASYDDYGDEIAKILGFSPNMDELMGWAEQNPEIWGNKNGEELFSSATAFGKRYRQKIKLQDIATHWYGVAERLAKMEQKK